MEEIFVFAAVFEPFPLDGAMHGVHVGFNVYEDCRGILMRNPSVRPDAGFARIDSTWISKFFR